MRRIEKAKKMYMRGQTCLEVSAAPTDFGVLSRKRRFRKCRKSTDYSNIPLCGDSDALRRDTSPPIKVREKQRFGLCLRARWMEG